MQQVRMRRRYSALLLLVGEAAADADVVLGVRPQDRQMAWPFPSGTSAKLDQLRARPDVPQERGRELAGAADRDRRAWKGLGSPRPGASKSRLRPPSGTTEEDASLLSGPPFLRQLHQHAPC